jgi:hypothetical protein
MGKRNEVPEGPSPRAARRGAPVRSRGMMPTVPKARVKASSAVEWLSLADAAAGILRTELPDETWVVVVDGTETCLTERILRAIRAASDSARIWIVRDAPDDHESLPAEETGGKLELHLSDATDAAARENLIADLVVLPAEPSVTVGTRIGRWLGQAARIVMEDPTDDTLGRTIALRGGSGCDLFALRTEAAAEGSETDSPR